MKTLLAIVALIVCSSDAFGDDSGVTLHVSTRNGEAELLSYREVGKVKWDLGLFDLKKGDTEMYGVSPGIGYRFYKFVNLKFFVTGHVSEGITVSPKVSEPECVKPVQLTLTQDPNTVVKTAKDDVAQAQQQVKEAQNSYDNSVANENYSNCKALRSTKESLSPYGATGFYDLGIQEKGVFWHVTTGLYAGYRWQQRSQWGNIGALDVNGPVAMINAGVEW